MADNLMDLLAEYQSIWPGESATIESFDSFVKSGEILQGKNNLKRHITASAFIINSDCSKTLLTHHVKLGIWVQLGGHTQPGEDWLDAALREAHEESGIVDLSVVDQGLFDIDIHAIPERELVPAHDHYDLRFLLKADDSQALTVSDESHDLAWVSLRELDKYSQEVSIKRMADKIMHHASPEEAGY